ncbi:hypothetical protein FACS189490_10130 [Clostridia bacterium]|nr:hypothetical protein FACS189490_10130 [Clostridia bacterium]
MRADKIKNDDKGLSLVELVIAVTILSVLSVMLTQFLSVASNFYRRQQQETAFQTNSQVVINTLAEYIQDCTSLPEIDGNAITVENGHVDGGNVTFTFHDETIWIIDNEDSDGDGDRDDDTEHPLMKGVKEFSVPPPSGKKKSITVTFQLVVWGKESKYYTTVIYMRNWKETW